MSFLQTLALSARSCILLLILATSLSFSLPYRETTLFYLLPKSSNNNNLLETDAGQSSQSLLSHKIDIRSPRQYCGSELVNALQLVCGGNYYKRDPYSLKRLQANQGKK
jgi:hypothetical protein